MKTFTLLLIACLTFVILSCKKDTATPSEPKASPLKGCCEMPATNETFGNGKVYIPNIFTPNQDGLNDYLMVFTDSVTNVILFQVVNDMNNVVYEVENFTPNKVEYGWDGLTNGELLLGLYSYTVILEAEDGTIHTSLGKSCNYPCGFLGEVEEIIPSTDCQYPSQTQDGQNNPTIDPGESTDCF